MMSITGKDFQTYFLEFEILADGLLFFLHELMAAMQANSALNQLAYPLLL